MQSRLYEQELVLRKTVGCNDLKMSYFILAGPLINKHLIFRSGHSGLTEPIGSVPQFLQKFGSQNIATDRLFSEVGNKEIRFRFGSFYNRINPIYLNRFTK